MTAKLDRIKADIAEPATWVVGPLTRGEAAWLTDEVDRLTRELADCEAHLTGARRDFEAASRVMLERHEAELAAETELRKLAQQSLVSAGTEHARDLGHLADRNRELAKRDEVTKLLALRVADAELGLAERTRERDDAFLAAATALRDDDAWDNLAIRALDLAAKWIAMGGDGRDKRSQTLSVMGRQLATLVKLYPEEPQP